ncbi:hypothetical protein KIPB_013807, partial [Kipferlia bialata]
FFDGRGSKYQKQESKKGEFKSLLDNPTAEESESDKKQDSGWRGGEEGEEEEEEADEAMHFRDVLKLPKEIYVCALGITAYYATAFPFIEVASGLLRWRYGYDQATAASYASIIYAVGLVTSPVFGPIIIIISLSLSLSLYIYIFI